MVTKGLQQLIILVRVIHLLTCCLSYILMDPHLRLKAQQRCEDAQDGVEADLPGHLWQLRGVLQEVLQNVHRQLDGLNRSLRLWEEIHIHKTGS